MTTPRFNNNSEGKHQGEVRHGKMHGFGTLEFSDKKYISEIAGYLDEEYFDDEYDFVISNDKVKYEGWFQDGKFYGDGELKFAEDWDHNYILFKGKFLNGNRNGYGVFMHGDLPFEGGEYKDDKLNGKGFIHYGNRDYEGEFKNGMFNGYGSLTLANGERYEGQFSNGQYNGYGTLFRKNGTRLEGVFCDNSFISDKIEEQTILNLSFQKQNNPEGLYLFIDTETTGLPKRLVSCGETDDNYIYREEENLLTWPRLVRLSYLIQDNKGTDLVSKDFIIKPDGFTIPTDSVKIHGISTEMATQQGIPLKSVLRHFRQVYDYARYIVGHNIYFDTKVITAEFLRNNIQDTFTDRSKIDTMGASVDFCGLKGHYSYKYPTLSELHQKLFGKGFQGAHSAEVDVRIVASCFWKLKQLAVI